MSFELLCLIVFVVGMSAAVFISEATAKKVVEVIAAIGGIIWAVIQIVRAIR